MNNEIENAILKLDRHRDLTLRDAGRDCIHVHWGRVWITRSGDGRDHVVNGGESLAISRDGTTVLTAMSDAGVSLMKHCASPDTKLDRTVREQGADDGLNAALGMSRSAMPSYEEIDRRVDRAHQLRADVFSEAIGRAWASVRGALAI